MYTWPNNTKLIAHGIYNAMQCKKIMVSDSKFKSLCVWKKLMKLRQSVQQTYLSRIDWVPPKYQIQKLQRSWTSVTKKPHTYLIRLIFHLLDIRMIKYILRKSLYYIAIVPRMLTQLFSKDSKTHTFLESPTEKFKTLYLQASFWRMSEMERTWYMVDILTNEYPDVKFYLRFVLLQLMDLWELSTSCSSFSAVQNSTATTC
jgi:hypothetical protein